MVRLDQVIKEFAINGRSVDTEGTRASGITKEIVERFVVEAECSNEHHKHGLWLTDLDGTIRLGHTTAVRGRFKGQVSWEDHKPPRRKSQHVDGDRCL